MVLKSNSAHVHVIADIEAFIDPLTAGSHIEQHTAGHGKKRCFNLILCDLLYFDSKTSVVAIFGCFVPRSLHTIPNLSINMVL